MEVPYSRYAGFSLVNLLENLFRSMEQYLQGAAVHGDFNEDQNWKSLTATHDQPETNPSAGFECNICLDLVRDPVVTFCRHLYCWPCIYRWISFQDDDASPENPDHQKPQCPVCKRDISEKTLIPLYGRGQTTNTSSKEHSHLIPQRPPSPRCGANLFLPNTIDSHRLRANRHDRIIQAIIIIRLLQCSALVAAHRQIWSTR
ncbi:hypothetical protein DH2020_045561 [Rehmannia glutinosa]|uniref:E3 ubiquitin-protein ligase RMA n=1 Tax=Rehmannia glutinosa TaxID=99300 RepID=A0ABR0UDU5_REHGL